MRLLVDLQAGQGPSASRGIGYYATSLTTALAASRRDHEVVVLLDGSAPLDEVLRLRAALSPAVARSEVVLVPRTERGDLDASVADEAVREAVIAALGPDVVLLTSLFELADGAPASVNEHCADVPHVAVLYDLIPLTDLDRYKFRDHERRAYLQGVARLARLELLLSISDFSAAEARRLVDPCPPVTTVGGAPPPRPAPRALARTVPPGYGLAVGGHEPRKDVRTAVLAWAGLPTEVRAGRPFVVVGVWGREEQDQLRIEAVATGLPSGDLRFVGKVDDAELAWLYEHADLLAFPSLVEGLGLPPLEAMQAGAPVLMARSSSLTELVDDALPYVTPGDVGELRDRMAEVLGDGGVRRRLLALGAETVSRWTWERTAARAWDVLEGLVRPKLPPACAVDVVDGGGGRRTQLEVAASAPTGAPVRALYAGVEGCEDALVARPGVVLLDAVPDGDVDVLLAPAVGVLAGRETATALLAAGLTGSALAVVDDVPAQAALAFETDPLEHWCRAPSAASAPLEDHPLLHRPRWAMPGRPPVFGSDVTVYQWTPFLSGIQRTALRLHDVLRDRLAPLGGAVVPLQLGEAPSGVAHPALAQDPVVQAATAPVEQVDWALCIDLNGHMPAARQELQRARAHGTAVLTNIFDLLPWSNPEWWPHGVAEAGFLPWLRNAVAVSDVLVVNSRATAQQLERYVSQETPARVDGFVVQLLRLGCDLDVTTVRAAEREAAHFLVVGTVEPRKGHRTVLDAAEELWLRGVDVRLTVLGRQGWLVDDLAERMQDLQRREPRFTWLTSASDATLADLYERCTAAVVASEAEGFGLPLVEAAVRGCPVVVNDVPVLRELAGPEATYFSAQEPLAGVLSKVVADPTCLGPVAADALLTWEQVGDRLLGITRGEVPPLARWTPSNGWDWVT